jgi:long-chain fatty acid transport protein
MFRFGSTGLTASALLAALTLNTAVFADGVVLNGISSRSLGRGGTNLGFADNGGILHDNPAAMTNIEGEGLVDVGVTGVFPNFTYADTDNPDGVRSSRFSPLPQVSYIRKSEDGVFAYGLGVFTPAGFCEKYDMNGPAPFVGQQRYQSFGALMKVLPGVACQVTEEWSVGGTFGVGVSYASLEGPYFLQNAGPFTGVPTLMNVHGTGATPVWSLGTQLQLTESTTVGATYTSVSDVNLSGNTSVTIPGLGSTSYQSTLEAVWPQSVGLGVKQQLGPATSFSTDLIWFDWSSAFDEFVLTLEDSRVPGFPPVVERFPLGWRDSLSVRLGLEHEVFESQTVRCGYVHHRIAVPDATLTPFLQATMEHAASVGYGWRWSCCELDVGYMYLWGSSREIATSSFVGGDFNNATHHAQIHAGFASVIVPF